MIPIPVKSHPFRKTFNSFRDAIEHSRGHSGRALVEADAKQLRAAALNGGYWSLSDFVLDFSNGQWLHIFVADAHVQWELCDSQPVLSAEPQFQIGAPPILLDWQGTVGICEMDPSDLVTKRIGAKCNNLFTNDTGFFVYFDSHLVFQFHPAFRTDTCEDLLYVTEED